MGRPPKEEEGKARQALIDAFWELLAEDDYTQLSIRSLSNRAHVNHNTFYRYFENIDDLARKAFEEVVPKHAPDFLRKAAAAEDINPFAFFNYAMFRDYSHFARLFIMSDSLYLNQVMQDTIKWIWLDYLNVQEEELNEEERIAVSFVLGGLISAMRECRVDPHFARGEVIQPLFSAVVNTMLAIGKRHHAERRQTTRSYDTFLAERRTRPRNQYGTGSSIDDDHGAMSLDHRK